MEIRFEELKKIFEIERKKPPDYSTIRNIILEVDRGELENQLRLYAKEVSKVGEGT